MPPLEKAANHYIHRRIERILHFRAEAKPHLDCLRLNSDRNRFVRQRAAPLRYRQNVANVYLVRRQLAGQVYRKPVSLQHDDVTGICVCGDRVEQHDAIAFFDDRQKRHSPGPAVGKLDVVQVPLVSQPLERYQPETVIAHQWAAEPNYGCSAHVFRAVFGLSGFGHSLVGILLMS